MKTFIFTFIFIVIFTTQARGTCDFNQYSGDIRLGVINDDQVYTLFTTHTTQEHGNAAMSFTATPTVEHAISRLNAVLDIYQPTIQSEQSDVRQIIELLESEQIDWIGIEASPKEIQETPILTTHINSEYSDMKDRFNEFNVHQDWNSNKTNQILHFLFPKIIIAYAQNPEAFQGIRIVPLESDEQRAEGFEIESRINAQKNILADFLHTRLITLSQFQTIEALFLDRLYNIIKSNSNSEIESILESLQEEARVAVNTYLDQINEFVHLKEKRSQTASVSISSQSGNGLVIMGSSHAKDIEEYLTASCQTISPIDEDSRTAIKIE